MSPPLPPEKERPHYGRGWAFLLAVAIVGIPLVALVVSFTMAMAFQPRCPL